MEKCTTRREGVDVIPPKVVILALDGLEYTLVEKRKFSHLKQVEYGKVKVPITDIGEPSTPIVWMSFITGKSPEEHGITTPTLYKNKLINYCSHLISNDSVRRYTIHFSSIQKILNHVGLLKIISPNKSMLKASTIFDLIPNSISIDLPVLNKNVGEKYKGFIEAVVNREKREEYVEFLWSDFRGVKQKLLRKICGSTHLIMAHFQLTDLYGHIYCKSEGKILELYEIMDQFVSEISKLFCGWLLIISDHGIDKNYGHSSYGFYSSNIKLNLTYPHITDFFNLIMEVCT